MNVTIIGSGAMGSLFGGILAADGHDVVLVDLWEEHVRTINDDGLTITTPNGDERTVDVRAVTDPSDAGPIDLVVIFVKSTHTAVAVEDAAAILHDEVDVLTLQNGLGNPECIAEYVPEEQIIAGVTAYGSTLAGPGHVIHAGEGPTTIGRYFTENDDRVRTIATAFTKAGIEMSVTDDSGDAVWEKVLVNIGINASTALARVKNGLLAETEPGHQLIESAVTEASKVARDEGRTVREDIVEYVTDLAAETGENRSSMRQDMEAGRQTEIEFLNGEIVRRGEKAGIAVPVNRTLTTLVKLAECGMSED